MSSRTERQGKSWERGEGTSDGGNNVCKYLGSPKMSSLGKWKKFAVTEPGKKRPGEAVGWSIATSSITDPAQEGDNGIREWSN